jgi:trigger factor
MYSSKKIGDTCMQVMVDQISDLERCLTICVPSAELEPKIHQKLLATAQKARIKGFRPGKVPLKEVQRRYGDSIRFDAISEMIDERYKQAIKDQDLKPVSMPSIELTQSAVGQDLEFKAKFEVLPEFDLGNISQAKVEVPEASIEQSDIDAVIEKMRIERSNWVDADDVAAENGLQVRIDFVGTMAGEAFEGGTATDFDLELGTSSMIPGFEEQLLGVRVGEQKVLKVSFPEDYHNKILAGQAAEFVVQVKQIQRRQLPELDAEFFKTLGLADGKHEDFVALVTKNMQRMLVDQLEQQRKTALLDALLEVVDIKVPQALIEQELDRQRSRFKAQFEKHAGSQAFSAEFLKQLFTNDAAREQAIKQVKQGLLMTEVAEQQQVQPSIEQIQAKARDMAAGYENPDAVVAYYLSDKRTREQISLLAQESLIVEKLLQQVQVTVKPVKYLELMKIND